MNVPCVYCREEFDPDGPFLYRRVTGWERKAHGGSRRGGSDIVLREPFEEFACAGCIALRKDGISPSQASLM